MTITIRVLAETAQIDQVFDACFFETSTIGLRYQILSRMTLDRWKKNCATETLEAECKFVIRPGATTVKVEADALVDIQGHANREGIRREVAIKHGASGD